MIWQNTWRYASVQIVDIKQRCKVIPLLSDLTAVLIYISVSHLRTSIHLAFDHVYGSCKDQQEEQPKCYKIRI